MTTFQRFDVIGTTPQALEKEGLEALRDALPTYGPFGGFALFSFQSDDGRAYAIDAIALTAHCLYVIAMRPWRGVLLEGDARHLVFESSNGAREVVDHPLPLLDVKTKAFKNRVRLIARLLDNHAGDSRLTDALAPLAFEPLVWLPHAETTKLGDQSSALSHIVLGRQNIGDALRQASFPGAPADMGAQPTTLDTLKALRHVLRHPEFGIAPIDKPLTVLGGRFTLTELVEEGDDYQDHWAVPLSPGPHCRVRSYLAPRQDRAFVKKLDRRAERESATLFRLGDHPDILALEQFDPKGPLGPALVFRGFLGETLDAFLKESRDNAGRSTLNVEEKITVLRRVARALAFCHRNDVIHGALSPEAVLVHRGASLHADEPGPIEVKLTRFALAASGDPTSEGSRLFTRLAGASASLYEAPEVARGAPASISSDVFSLGALAYFLLAEEPPATSTAELAIRLGRDRGLVISAVRDDLFPAGVRKNLDHLLWAATSVDPITRAEEIPGPLDFIERLEEALHPAEPSQEAEAPAPPKPNVNPLTAVKGSALNVDLTVIGELGSGATARVFKVYSKKERGEAALKVPLSEAHDDRIAREAEVLERLARVPGASRVARYLDTLVLDGRTCLLVQFAGDRTLADEIRAEGALSLDYARRFGDDLLTALRSLEEAGIQHRDIKPANIGLTSGSEKGKKRLLLFDFSLSQRPADEIGVGTPAYKDPGLLARGRWDDAADRWAAAITLHEMFTGVRPAPLPAASDKAVAVRVEPDRFDPDVRDGLVRFFERSFRMAARERFATAYDMRDAFLHALDKVPELGAGADEDALPSASAWKGLGPESRVSEISLSARLRNALDRMGIYTLQELALVSSNRIGGVRGVGAQTARLLVDLAKAVREHLTISASEGAPPFFRGFGGARVGVDEEVVSARLSPKLASRFLEAGLADSVAVASAPAAQVKNLVARARKDGAREAPRDVTAWLSGLVDAARPPSTLGAAAELIAPSAGPKGGASRTRLRQYLGLEPIEGFPRHGSMHDLARATGKTRALVSADIAKARERWTGGSEAPQAPKTPLDAAGPTSPPGPPTKTREIAVLERALAAVSGALAASAGVTSMERAAASVLEALPPEPDLGPDDAKRCAEALVRAVTELDSPRISGARAAEGRLRLRRARKSAEKGGAGPDARDDVLVAWDKTGFELASALGAEADALVFDQSVIAESTAGARLREAIRADAELDPASVQRALALPERALVALAAATASKARVSVRGELYAVGLPVDRAVRLSAAAIAGEITVDELRRRVLARYPESGPFPDDPAKLEALAAEISLRFDADRGVFLPREVTVSGSSTELGAPASVAAPGPSRAAPPPSSSSPGEAPREAKGRPKESPADVVYPALSRERAEGDVLGATAARVFDEELERARREGAFRVLLWRGFKAREGRAGDRGAPDADPVARVIARRCGGDHEHLDALLINAAAAIAVEKKLRGGLAPAIDADARGPDSPAWPRLVDLMRLAADRAVAELLTSPSPRARVLTRLGLLARYDLLASVAQLAAAYRSAAPPGGLPSMFVVLPVFAGEGAVVGVGSDVADRVPVVPGTLLMPVPGLLPLEILDVPASWMERHGEPRPPSGLTPLPERL